MIRTLYSRLAILHNVSMELSVGDKCLKWGCFKSKIKGVHVAEAHTEVLWLSYIWILRKYLNLILTFVQVPKFWFIFVILYALLLLVQCNLPYCSPKIFSFTSMFLSQSGKHYENNRNGKYMPFFNLGEIFGPGCKIQPKKLWFFFH